ncbi:hypothetical protein BHS07_08900 [Myxococcus xanthus]|nr:hypothetical protein BHS07_08900 [Myxococcus xanthus]
MDLTNEQLELIEPLLLVRKPKRDDRPGRSVLPPKESWAGEWSSSNGRDGVDQEARQELPSAPADTRPCCFCPLASPQMVVPL